MKFEGTGRPDKHRKAQTSANQLISPYIVSFTQNNRVCVHVGETGVPVPSFPLMGFVGLKNNYKLTNTSTCFTVKAPWPLFLYYEL